MPKQSSYNLRIVVCLWWAIYFAGYYFSKTQNTLEFRKPGWIQQHCCQMKRQQRLEVSSLHMSGWYPQALQCCLPSYDTEADEKVTAAGSILAACVWVATPGIVQYTSLQYCYYQLVVGILVYNY